MQRTTCALKEDESMNKTIIFLITILSASIISGCSHTNEVSSNNLQIKKPQKFEQSDVSEQKQYMKRPEIIFTSGHSYREGEGWLGKNTEINGNSLRASGDSIFLEIIFDTAIDYESIKEKIKLIGSDNFIIEKHPSKENALRILARNIESSKTYQLYIPKTIIDTKGNPLEDDIRIDIVVEKEAKAFYTFVGQEVTINDLGERTDDFGNIHTTLPATNKTITFLVDFTKNVDKESVENSIKKNLNHEGQVNFEWVNKQKLKLTLNNFPTDKEYVVSMEEAKDESNNKIIGNLFFTVLEPTQLSSINLQTRKGKLLKEFVDLPYMVVPSEDYEQYFIADDAKKKYIVDVEHNSMKELQRNLKYAFGFPNYEWYSNWLNSHTALALDEDSNSIFTHDFINGEVNKLFTIPLKIEPMIYDIKLSPNRDKIAITNSINEMNMYVFSLKGEMLFNGEKIANNHTRHNSTVSMYLQWLDDNTIVFQDEKDIAKLDLTTGVKETIIKDAQEPVVCQNGNYLLVKKFKENKFVYNISDNQEIELGSDIGNFTPVSKNKFLYNQEQDIVLFDISQNKKETIGKGKIVGVSPDKETIYYTNVFNSIE